MGPNFLSLNKWKSKQSNPKDDFKSNLNRMKHLHYHSKLMCQTVRWRDLPSQPIISTVNLPFVVSVKLQPFERELERWEPTGRSYFRIGLWLTGLWWCLDISHELEPERLRWVLAGNVSGTGRINSIKEVLLTH